MKKILIILLSCFCGGFFISCDDGEFKDDPVPIIPVPKPIKAVTADDGNEVATAFIDNEERTIELSLKNLKSLSNVTVHLHISKRAKLINPTDTVVSLDLTNPYPIVVNNSEEDLTYILTAEIIPQLKVSELWKKTGSLMHFSKHNNRSIGISGDYIVVHDRSASGANRYYDIETGEEAGVLSNEGVDIDALHMITDDAGNIITGSFTPGAGNELKVFWWNCVEATPELLLTWTSDAPDNIGRKFYVKGDMNKLAYLYVTVSNNDMFYRWEIKNGRVTSATPDKIEFEHPNGGWGINGRVIPVSVGKNSNYFINTNKVVRITYMNGEDNTPIYNSEENVEGKYEQWLNNGGHGFDYVNMNGEHYLFVIEQNGTQWFTPIFNVKKVINNPSSIEDISTLVHSRVWNSWLDFPLDPAFGGRNENVTGDVKARVAADGKSAIVAFICANGGVKVWRVTIE